ncbi:MAG: hypothetical protein K2N80_05690 [Lachnospiraceae bacterium]|nr:hypothetical protein [Lachnospiraceae bacterium]
MGSKMYIQWIVAALFVSGLSLCNGCGDMRENEETASAFEMPEISLEEGKRHETAVKESSIMDDSIAGTLHKIPKEENGILEIYAGRDVIAIDNMMTAQVSPQEILKGNPVIYDRFRVDGWVFEWLISDYHDEGDWSMEDGVLLISREGVTKDAQIIHVTAEGGYGTWVFAEDKFEYVDVNFDGNPDLLICTGHHGNQGLLTYYCFLQTENGFTEAPTFTDISNPAIDAEDQLIRSQWRNSAASHSWAEYKCQNNTYVRYRVLCEDVDLSGVINGGEEVWVWTVNDEEVARSDELSEEEIAAFLYGENSEWKLADDRWRTLYNDGLTVDYSIYSSP